MAEGGYDDFENPAFDKDYEEGNINDAEKHFLWTFFEKNQETQRIAEQQMESMEHQSGETLEDTRKKVIKEKLDNFILVNKKRGGTPVLVNPGTYHIKDRILHVQPFGTYKETPLEYKRGGVIQPYNLRYLEKRYGIAFI